MVGSAIYPLVFIMTMELITGVRVGRRMLWAVLRPPLEPLYPLNSARTRLKAPKTKSSGLPGNTQMWYLCCALFALIHSVLERIRYPLNGKMVIS